MEAEKNEAITAGAEASEIERLKDEVRREHDMYLRALADFENYRKRVERDRASEIHRGKRDLVIPLLELIDDFEQALHHLQGAPASVVEGLRTIHRNFLSVLESQGITPLRSVGEPFNPALHEAAGPVETDEYKPGAVAGEERRGYLWGDELLRPARVRVAR